MTESQERGINSSPVKSLESITDQLPAAEWTALLYHLSYLYLDRFPELEQQIGRRALETQCLFLSSKTVLFKCSSTAENLAKSLLPILKVAVERNMIEEAKASLEEAKKWIGVLICASKEIKAKYDRENSVLAKTTSDIHSTGSEAGKDGKTVTMNLIQLNFKQGTIPSKHFEEVKKCLSRIQQVLILTQTFWEHAEEVLDYLEQKTFSALCLISDLKDFRDIFLDSMTEAEKVWAVFSQSCIKAQKAFDIQAKDAYKFREIIPSSLPEEEWQKHCDIVKEKLEKVKSLPSCSSHH